jgi:hypothetical protein
MAFSGDSDEQCVKHFLSSEGQEIAEAVDVVNFSATSKANTELQTRLKKFKATQQLLKDLFGNLMMVRRPLSMDYVMKSVAIDNDGETLSMKNGTENSLFSFFEANSSLSHDDIYEKTKGIKWRSICAGERNEEEHVLRRSVFDLVPESSSASRNMFLIPFSPEEESALFGGALFGGNYVTAMKNINDDEARWKLYKKQNNAAQKFRKKFVDAYTVLRGVNSCCAWVGVDPDQICHASQGNAAKLSVAAVNMRNAYDAFYND